MRDFAAEAERERKNKVRASSSVEQATGVIGWLRERLQEQMRYASSADRIIEVRGQLAILQLHATVSELSEYDQRVYPFRAQCDSESWVCYGDGEEHVQAPCLHVKLLAWQFAWREDFPRPLAMTEAEQESLAV